MGGYLQHYINQEYRWHDSVSSCVASADSQPGAAHTVRGKENCPLWLGRFQYPVLRKLIVDVCYNRLTVPVNSVPIYGVN